MTDTAGPAGFDLTGLPAEQALRLGAVTSDLIQAAERRGAIHALDRLAEKAASDRQWEDGMGNAHAWVRDLIADVRAELADDTGPAPEPRPFPRLSVHPEETS